MGLTRAESRALTIHRSALLTRLEPDDVVDYLYSYDMINQQQFEDIKSLTTRHRKCELLLSILQRGLSVHFELFVRVLQKTNQGHLAQLLRPSVNPPGPAAPAAAKAATANGGPASAAMPPSSSSAAVAAGVDGDGCDSRSGEPPADCLDFERSTAIIDVAVRPCTDPGILALLDSGGRRSGRSPAVYRMTQPTRGRALVLCNTSFVLASKLAPRPSADNDATNMSSLLQRLGFDVRLLRNATREELQAAIDDERRNPAHASLGAFALYVSSHGEDGAVFGTDGQRLLLDDVYDALDGRGCPQLAGKPKLIVVESSQGPLLDRGVGSEGDPTAPACPDVGLQLKQFSIPSSAAAAAAAPSAPGSGGRARGRLPAKADFVVALSTFAGYASLRHSELGCWFSRAMVEAFAKHACDEHVTQLLRRVRRMVLQAETDLGYKQVSMTHDTLLKDFYLFPGVMDPLTAGSS